jgi:CDP-diglyceride synthetase
MKKRKIDEKTPNYTWKGLLYGISITVIGGLIIFYHKDIITALKRVICSTVGIIIITIAGFVFVIYGIIKYNRHKKKKLWRLEQQEKRKKRRDNRVSLWEK